MLRTVVGVALVGLSAGRAALGQAPGHQSKQSPANVSLDQRINEQALIRVRGAWGTADLDQPRLIGDTLIYAAAQSQTSSAPPTLPRPLTLHAVDRIQVRGSAAGTGALVGAGIGLAGGLAGAIALAASLCNDGGCSNETGGMVTIAVVSTAGGALLGAIIGAPIKKWKTVYRRPD